MTLPKGKVVIIQKNGTDIMPTGTTLTLDTEVTLSLQSHFDSLLGSSSINKMATLLSGVLKSTTGLQASGAFKQMGYQMWSGTDPLTFAFTTTLNMKTSGKTDVLDPAKVLMNLVLPIESDSGGFGLEAPGPTLIDAVGLKAQYSKKYSFRCGIIYLPNIIVTRAEPTFSDDVDTEGYPIWCTLNMELSTVFVATTKLIDNFSYIA